jgi:hypothetical protein
MVVCTHGPGYSGDVSRRTAVQVVMGKNVRSYVKNAKERVRVRGSQQQGSSSNTQHHKNKKTRNCSTKEFSTRRHRNL